jgi:hypothetical protein
MPIKIDLSQVPEDKQRDPRFLSRYSELQKALSIPEFIRIVCIHEAAHYMYQAALGATDFKFHGPQIVYDKEQNKFDVFSARVEVTAWTAEFSSQDAKDIVLQMAIIGVAGELATIAIEGKDEGSGTGDYLVFHEIYTRIGKASYGTPLDIWDTAQKRVAAQLQNNDIRSRILDLATEIEPKLFAVL